MINKQNLWFLTLFSLIIVLSIYYVTMKSDDNLTKLVNGETTNITDISVNEADILVALRVSADEETLKNMEELQNILLSATATVDEKNLAYENLLMLNSNKGKEQKIEQKIKELFQLEAFVRIKNDQINIVIKSSTHSANNANEIIKAVQDLFEQKMYITVKYQT